MTEQESSDNGSIRITSESTSWAMWVQYLTVITKLQEGNRKYVNINIKTMGYIPYLYMGYIFLSYIYMMMLKALLKMQVGIGL